MAAYKYEATTKNGQLVQGEKEAETRDEIVDFLHAQDLIVVSIEEKIGFSLKSLGDILIGGIPLKEKVFFVKQFAAMLNAGLSVVQSIEILIEQTKSSGIKNKLTAVYNDVKGGLPISSSFGKRKVIFDDLQISLIEAGEKSGNLIEIMRQVADDMDKSHRLRSKVRGAMIYPGVIFVTAIIVVIVLVIFLVPAVEGLYADLGASDKIPGITKFLVTLSDVFTNPVGVITMIVLITSIILFFRYFYTTFIGRHMIDKLQMRLPVFGDLIIKMQVLSMSRLLSLMIRSGIPIIDALKSTGKSLGNIHFKDALFDTADAVSKGSTISVPLAEHRIFPIMVVKMIATGEETGSLDKILQDVSIFYEAEVEDITSNLTKLMEPIMLLVVGGIVAFLAIAVYLPLFSIAEFV